MAVLSGAPIQYAVTTDVNGVPSAEPAMLPSPPPSGRTEPVVARDRPSCALVGFGQRGRAFGVWLVSGETRPSRAGATIHESVERFRVDG
ncbi:MAG TPA: hypothetical protein VKU41_23430 [Polyangiaceae bacterium]|nr:hypothetical protein [Polyangiaceae bacterium]